MGSSELRAAVVGLDRRYRGQRYPRELRDRLIAQARQGRRMGKSWTAMGRELGVRGVTLRRWCEDGGNVVRLAKVGVVNRGRLRVVSPSGWSVEGISVEEATRVLSELA